MQTISSYHSGVLLTDICVKKQVYSWPAIGELACGLPGRIGVEILQTVNIFLTGILVTQAQGAFWQQAFEDVPLCLSTWIFISTATFAMFLQIPSFAGSLPMRVATAITVTLTAWRVVLFFVEIPLNGQYCHVCHGGQTVTTILSAAANLVFTFGSHAIMPEEVREMRVPEEMYSAYNWAYGVAIPFYFLIGFLGFWAFGVFASGSNLLLNFPDSPEIRAYLIPAAILLYLPVSYGSILLFLKVELRLGILPTDWLTVSNVPVNRVSFIPPVLFRLIFRCSVVGIYLLFAQMFIGFGLGNVTSLVGSIAICALTFYLPFVFHMVVFWDEFRGFKGALKVVWYALNIAFGILLSAGGIYFTVQQIAESEGGELFQAPCMENSYFFGGDNSRGNAYLCDNTTEYFQNFFVPTCVLGKIDCSQYGACYSS